MTQFDGEFSVRQLRGRPVAGAYLRIPVICHVHEINIRPALLKNFLRFVLRKCATKVIFVSQSFYESEKYEGLDQCVIYNALDCQFEADAINHVYQPRDSTGIFNVLMVCSLKVYKGILEYLDIAKKLVNEESIRFLLVVNENQHDTDIFFQSTIFPTKLATFPIPIIPSISTKNVTKFFHKGHKAKWRFVGVWQYIAYWLIKVPSFADILR